MKSILEKKELGKKDANLVFALSPRATKDKKVFTVSDLMETDTFFYDYCAFRKLEPGYPLVTEFESLLKSNCYTYEYVVLGERLLNPRYMIKALRKSFGADGLTPATGSKMNAEEIALYHKFSRAIFYEPIQEFNHKLRTICEEDLIRELLKGSNALYYIEFIESNFREYFRKVRSRLKGLDKILPLKDPSINFSHWLPYRKYAIVMELYEKFIESHSYVSRKVELIEGLPLFETLSITAGRRVAFKLARTEEFKKLLSVKRMLNGDFSQWESHKVQEKFREICLNSLISRQGIIF